MKQFKIDREKWKLVGHFGVDAGICWIGDPCYILHKEVPCKTLGSNWAEFCNTIPDNYPTLKSYKYELGHEGLGICVSTGYGDGFYPVYALVLEKRVAAVFIDFFNLLDDDDPEEEE